MVVICNLFISPKRKKSFWIDNTLKEKVLQRQTFAMLKNGEILRLNFRETPTTARFAKKWTFSIDEKKANFAWNNLSRLMKRIFKKCLIL
jgi:hypothetical protein